MIIYRVKQNTEEENNKENMCSNARTTVVSAINSSRKFLEDANKKKR